jgi:hypothetical protein
MEDLHRPPVTTEKEGKRCMTGDAIYMVEVITLTGSRRADRFPTITTAPRPVAGSMEAAVAESRRHYDAPDENAFRDALRNPGL